MKKYILIMILLSLFIPKYIHASIIDEIKPKIEIEGVNEDEFFVSKTIKNNTLTIDVTEKNTGYKYSWSFDKTKINDIITLNLNIDFESKKKEEIDKLSGTIEKEYISFSHHGNLPSNTIVEVDVLNKFKDGEKLNLYYYNEDIKKIEFIDNNIEVVNGKVKIKIDHCSEYFLTSAIVNNGNTNKKSLKNIIYVLTFFTIILMAYTIFKNK